MGTMVTLIVPGGAGRADPVPRVARAFAALESRFSLYRDDTDLARVRDGTLALVDAAAVVRDAYALAMRWRNGTGGAFTPHRPDGVLDLDGIVKALAIEAAGDELDAAGVPDWCVDAGGDALVRGRGPRGAPWTAAVADPFDRGRVIATAVLDGTRRAIATSGTSERGAHVWSVPGDEPLVQASVVADDIVTADVLATAVLAGGRPLVDRARAEWGADVFAVLDPERTVRTPGWPQATLTPSSAPIA
ncbi:FAD:protein FMN transferase [Agromyces sp. SYSU T00194]|uniref:FAD:protein FMN transferase n=1 Tax=Agromyces chitinivorans TaxID=3158560 RepID=UPI00339146E4